jgi:hypothetical protein
MLKALQSFLNEHNFRLVTRFCTFIASIQHLKIILLSVSRQAISQTKMASGRTTDFFYAAIVRESLRADMRFKRSFQKASRRGWR